MPPRRRAALLALVLLLIGAPAAEAAEALAGRVVAQRGGVTALRDMMPRALRLGAEIRAGDLVVTGPEARVKIELQDGSLLAVGPSTRVEIADYALDAGGGGVSGIVSLLLGIVRTTLSETWAGGFEVRTRLAVASVRATDWVTEAKPEQASVFVVAGRVAVAGTSGGSVVLDPGFGTDVRPGEAPSEPKRWGAARVEDVLSRTSVP